MKNNNAIFISFDDNYLSYAKSCINSILTNYPSYPTILVNYKGSNLALKKDLQEIPNLQLISIDFESWFSSGPVGNSIVFDRYQLWSNYFSEFNSILHLDADVLVLDSLEDLLQKENFFVVEDGYPGSAIFKCDDLLIYCGDQNFDVEGFANWRTSRGIAGDCRLPMVNAGVFLITQDNRSQDSYDELIRLADSIDNYVAYADQSVISVWCALKNIAISKEITWNCPVWRLSEEHPLIHLSQVKILHYSGAAKSYEQLQIRQSEYNFYKACEELRLFYRRPRRREEAVEFRDKQIKKLYA